MAISDLRTQDFVDQMAGALCFGHRQKQVQLSALPARRDNTRGLQDGDMLREVRFRNAQFFLNLSGCPIAPAQQVEHTQTGRIREGLTDTSLTLENLGLDSATLPLFDRHTKLREPPPLVTVAKLLDFSVPLIVTVSL